MHIWLLRVDLGTDALFDVNQGLYSLMDGWENIQGGKKDID